MAKPSLIAAALLACVTFATTAHAQDAADLYKTKCAACHGASGSVTPTGARMGASDFDSPAVAKESDQALFDIIKNGQKMMPMYRSLTDDQIKDLVKYIRSLK
jgi:mono/diheme cytochrome c family protein